MKLDEVIKITRVSQNITIFTGAGLSEEAGIPTFRGENGLWDEFGKKFSTWQDVFFTLNHSPNEFREFFIHFVEPILNANPTKGHRAISELQKLKKISVITQNIDDLHSLAGTKSVTEIHGNLFEITNFNGNTTKIDKELFKRIVDRLSLTRYENLSLEILLDILNPILSFGQNGIKRPNLTMFGDPLDENKWNIANEACKSCDCLLIIGTSRTVYPAASLVDIARNNRANIVSINPGIEDNEENMCMKAGSALEIISASLL